VRAPLKPRSICATAQIIENAARAVNIHFVIRAQTPSYTDARRKSQVGRWVGG
jgi:hypothetical protein